MDGSCSKNTRAGAADRVTSTATREWPCDGEIMEEVRFRGMAGLIENRRSFRCLAGNSSVARFVEAKRDCLSLNAFSPTPDEPVDAIASE